MIFFLLPILYVVAVLAVSAFLWWRTPSLDTMPKARRVLYSTWTVPDRTAYERVRDTVYAEIVDEPRVTGITFTYDEGAHLLTCCMESKSMAAHRLVRGALVNAVERARMVHAEEQRAIREAATVSGVRR